MLANVGNFTKLLFDVSNCDDSVNIEKTFNLANEYRGSAMITEFEYLAVERAILEKIGVDTGISRYRGHLDIKKLLLDND